MAWVNIEELVRQNPPSQKEIQQGLDFMALKAKPRFYADEDFPQQAVDLLKAAGARVQTAREAELVGRSDEDHRAHALREGLVLLSRDRDFLDERRHPLIHCPAIFVFDFGAGSEAEMKQAFRCLKGVFRTPQFYDKWWKCDAKREAWTELVRHQDGTVSRTRMRVWEGTLQEWVDD
jgi:predicted nuclease of predicted toxin-antitoxin system